MAQLQHQLYVTGLRACSYISHRQNDIAVVLVGRDEEYIIDMVAKELDFKRRLEEFDPPPLTERDYEDLSHDTQLAKLIEIYEEDTLRIKQIQQRVDILKKDIKEIIGDKNAKGNGWKMTKYKVTGRVDYDTMIEQLLPDANLEQFRKPDSFGYRITVG